MKDRNRESKEKETRFSNLYKRLEALEKKVIAIQSYNDKMFLKFKKMLKDILRERKRKDNIIRKLKICISYQYIILFQKIKERFKDYNMNQLLTYYQICFLFYSYWLRKQNRN